MYSPLLLRLTRGDGSQNLSRINVTLPSGLLGKVADIPYCPVVSLQAAESKTGREEQQSPSCPHASELGTVSVGVGAGPRPYYASGHAYLAGPYKGAPFDLVVITPAVAGPYDLGDVVVRTPLYVDPVTAQIRAVSDPLPTILEGIPLDIRSIALNTGRPDFIFNPTSCGRLAIGGEAVSVFDQIAFVASRFQVGGCRELTFKPSFRASTQGNGTFNRGGASLKVKISTGQGPKSDPSATAEANIKKVDVALPVQLPSRLTTLQKACTERQFATNPAGCPTESNVGTATAHTPVLPVPLTGPAYLVSHGSAAFPDLDLILQGDGVTIVLTGSTDIKKGITFSRFDTTPDAPFSSFELNLPEGKFSALAANGNLCKPTKTVTVKKRVAVRRHGRVVHVLKSVKQQAATTLAMPTTITGQNGAVVTQTTRVAVTGCPKAKKLVKKHKKAKFKRHKRSR
jgi:hypothetical protein